MADKTVTVKLNADTHGFTAAMARAATASKQLGSQVKAHGAAFDRMASASTKAGLAVTAGVGGAVKAAVDWESAWTGVQKTVDASPAQYARLEGQLRSLASVLPVSHQEIAGVAEAAGQLGVKQQDVAKFTSTMVKLGTATNMTSEEAATNLRQFMNVMGTAPKDVDRLAATVVDLGNNSATTERDIVEMGQRLSGTGKQMRMSESQVMAFGAAMASVGINAEAGGTAMSRNWIKIDSAVRSGGKSLQTMAKVSGMSAAQFKKAWQTDAAGATNALIEGLGRASKSGQDVSKLLDQMGIKGQYQTDAMKRLAGASAGAGNAQDQLASSLKTAGEGWSQNTALQEEFGRRQQTTASQMQLAVNRIKDAAISLGQAALPVLGRAAQKVSEYANKFNGLSDHTKDMILQIGAFGGVSLIAAGQIGKVARAVKDVGLAFKAVRGVAGIAGAFTGIGGAATKAAGATEGAGKALSGVKGSTSGLSGKLFGVAAGLGALAIAWGRQDSANHAADIDKQLGSVADWSKQASIGILDLDAKLKQVNDGGFGPLRENLNGLGDALNHATGENLSFLERQEGRFASLIGSTADLSQQSKAQLGKFDEALSGLAGSHAWGDLQRNWEQIADAAKANHISDDKLMALFPKLQEGLSATARQLGVTGLSAKDYAGWLRGEVPSAVNRAAVANEKLAKSLGVVPDKKRVEVETIIKGGTQKQVMQLNAELAKVPPKKQSQVLATAKTKGFKAAMAQAKDFEKQAKGLQETTKHGVTVEIKGNTDPGKVHALREQLDGLSKAAAQKVSITAKTKGLDEAKKQLQQFQNTVSTTVTKQGITLKVKATATADLDRLRAKMEQLPKDKQIKVAATAKADGFNAAISRANAFKAEMDGIIQYTKDGVRVRIKGETDAKAVDTLKTDLEALPKEQQLKVAATAESKGFDDASKQLQDLRAQAGSMSPLTPIVVKATMQDGASRDLKILSEEATSVDGKKVLVTASAPGAYGATVQIDGLKYKVDKLDGKNVLIPLGLKNTNGTILGLKKVDTKAKKVNGRKANVKVGAPGSGNAFNNLLKVSGAANQLGKKRPQVKPSAPTAAKTSSQLAQVGSAADSVGRKRPRVATSAPGATRATGQVKSLGSTASRVNGKRVNVSAHANTSGARSALQALTRPLFTTVTATVHTVGSALKGVFHANGGLYERHDAQIAKAGAYRVWAEPETEGEAYIPFARSKRGRSREIATQTVQRLGGAVQWFANGGISGSQARAILNIEARPTGELVDYIKAVQDAANATRARERASRAWWNARRRHSKNEKKLGDALNAAKDKEKEATDKARQAQEALARAAEQAGASMAKDYRVGGSWQDWAASMRQGVEELDLFRWRLARLRNLGLSQDNIDTITAMGPSGLQLAGDVLAGGKKAVNSLNSASNSLKRVSDRLGLVSATRFADGGFSSGSGLRIWGEPETGGEAYIPLSPSKRAQSLQLWQETGRRLGALPAQGSSRPITPPGTAQPGYGAGGLDLSGVHITLSVPGLANAVDAKIIAANRSTARNLVRSTR
ncbi:phage tail tape measure protein [Cutibacterium avidum]|uniref:phage tail tape measure protein n=1 Tax=Cutibacterium avidum TaxID=33010 RepID=UPI00280C6A3B|nr:phage tail tape measure protein [Cutibacterium avidum]MDQ9080047.1 phage tail tape measure protein [Cutibacterium avidum]